MPASDDITQVLSEYEAGSEEAMARLIPVVYAELRRLAEQFLHAERRDHTLQPTALVHEVFLKLSGQQNVEWRNRAHVFGVAALAMRRILTDYARSHVSKKRGGRRRKLTLQDAQDPHNSPDIDLLALDEALSELAEIDAQQCHIVEYRFFAGLTIEETAKVMGISPATIKREWSLARAWLHRAISGDSTK